MELLIILLLFAAVALTLPLAAVTDVLSPVRVQAEDQPQQRVDR